MMRQITLGVALKSVGLNPRLFCFSIPDSLITRAHDFGLTVEKRSQQSNSSKLAEEIIATDCSIVVFDGYEFTHEVITTVFTRNVQVVLVDDNGDLADFPCHLILNQNLHANSKMYARNDSSPQLLLGLSWALIRPEVVAQREKVALSEKSGILLSVGGTDHRGITPILLEALIRATNVEVLATTGLGSEASVSPLEMANAMARAKLGIIACGTTMWEAFCLQLPFVGLITADNQVTACDSLKKFKSLRFIDVRSIFDVDKVVANALEALQEKQLLDENTDNVSRLIDGFGANRVAVKIAELMLNNKPNLI